MSGRLSRFYDTTWIIVENPIWIITPRRYSRMPESSKVLLTGYFMDLDGWLIEAAQGLMWCYNEAK